jgi:penicillin-binding protein 2
MPAAAPCGCCRAHPPLPGNNLVLTLDAKLQQVVEKAFGDRRGALVAIEPSTGGILALVSMPGYDPNLFVDGIEPAGLGSAQHLRGQADGQPRLNGAYPPGSTFKPFMALAALETGKRTPQADHFRPGLLQFRRPHLPRRQEGRPRHRGHVQVHRHVVRHLLLRAGQRHGHRRHLELHAPARPRQPDRHRHRGRVGGRAALAGMEEEALQKPEQQKWYAGETISIGIGQGYNAYTPIQLAQATAGLAKQRRVFRPHLVKHIENINTGERVPIEPEPLRTLPLKPANIEVIKRRPWSA